jgi:hypothetical protein
LIEEDLWLDVSHSGDSTQKVLPEIQQLFESYADIFATKVSFPPPIQYCHSIPLITGSRPVCVRHYMYVPMLKTEIEKQV